MMIARKRGITYHADGLLKGQRLRISLGTQNLEVAKRLTEKLELAVLDSPDSPRWTDLRTILPRSAFLRISELMGIKTPSNPTWEEFRALFELDMSRRVSLKQLSIGTVNSNRRILATFEGFLNEQRVKRLQEIDEGVIEDFKLWRISRIRRNRNSNGVSTLGLDIDVLHSVFAFAVRKGEIKTNPVRFMGRRWNPDKSTKPYTEHELFAMRNHLREDRLLFLLLLWTGFRRSDAVMLCLTGN